MPAEEIIQKILSKHPEVNREQVLGWLSDEKEKTGGLIAEATLLRFIAAKFGVEVPLNKALDHKLSTGLLIPNLNNVTVTGRIVAVYQAKTYEGKKPGKYASLIIADKDGTLRVMLWNDKADLVELGEVKVGQVARFSHGYTREDRCGKVELHLGDRSKIETCLQDAKEEDYPSVATLATKIRDITSRMQKVHVAGRVKEVFSSSTFTRQDQTEGKVLRFTVEDDTGVVAVVAWNEKAEELEAILNLNSEVVLVNSKVKAGSNGAIEIHVDAATFVDASVANSKRDRGT
jgi:replication factor A1